MVIANSYPTHIQNFVLQLQNFVLQAQDCTIPNSINILNTFGCCQAVVNSYIIIWKVYFMPIHIAKKIQIKTITSSRISQLLRLMMQSRISQRVQVMVQ